MSEELPAVSQESEASPENGEAAAHEEPRAAPPETEDRTSSTAQSALGEAAERSSSSSAKPKPKGRPKGRPKGSVNRPKTAVEGRTSSAAAVSAAPSSSASGAERSDLFEIIRQRQLAQHERRQAFYSTFLPP